MKWKLVYSNQAKDDFVKCKRSFLEDKIKELLDKISEDPFQPAFEKLKGYNNVYSRRINIKNRLVYEIIKDKHTVKILSMLGHYRDN